MMTDSTLRTSLEYYMQWAIIFYFGNRSRKKPTSMDNDYGSVVRVVCKKNGHRKY
uniref:AlNc14C7G955 protein n=1 Tax=Albugo laibachii Nc14 TaxID=890382 RepID=F0W1I7_9STRA|nr:AlNc14C7G955 [Albugo laibachii Nc14]|eukprot:CCA14916.1 AlNc14C7G955 [Albugo laibachii Nc14]